MQNPPPGQQSSTGLAPNVASALSYIWIVGLVFFFIEKENKFIRFHAMQSILWGVFWSVAMIVLVIINMIIAVGGGVAAAAAGDTGGCASVAIWLISMIIWLVIPLIGLAVLILCAVKAYQGSVFKLPILGNMAEKFSGGS
ncbi:MAG: hypothetical protein C5B55_03660 [Blastocatellia bacterium]|nr:MAG: hypothetical protein C5B55_03660 [Blastocatellia bacterium]